MDQAHQRALLGKPFVGSSAACRRLESELERVAAADIGVVIEGENGSGKNHAAQRIHALGRRAAGPYVEVPLGTLSPTLIEAELFGHEAGAFTGAVRARPGRFLRANGGTIVLDEIDGLAQDIQTKLLRVLQERTVEPIGSERSIPLDLRVITTTSRPLAAEVRAGRFREDLYFRLAVVTLTTPPLRQRAEDIGPLAQHFLARACARSRTPERALTPAAIERLRAHPWPGNLRELENAIERVLVLSADRGAPIDAGAFDFLGEAVDGMGERLAKQALAHGLGLLELERALLDVALRENSGNVAAAARQLGLSRKVFEARRAKTLVRADGDSSDA
ncbi:MAG: sigma 54-interacting transcriptional regulator [Planctomycetota bacterium]